MDNLIPIPTGITPTKQVMLPVSQPTQSLPQIVKTALVNPTMPKTTKHLSDDLNMTFSTVMTRAHVIFDHIVTQGSANAEEQTELKAVARQLKQLDKKLGALHFSDEERQEAKKHLKAAKEFVTHARQLPASPTALARLHHAHSHLMELTETGNLDVSSLRQLFSAILEIRKSPNLSNYSTFLSWDLDSIAWTMDEWASKIPKSARDEFHFLTNSNGNDDIARQLVALDDHLQLMIGELKRIRDELPTEKLEETGFHEQVRAFLASMKGPSEETMERLSKHRTNYSKPVEEARALKLPFLAYDTHEWRALLNNRPVKECGYIEHALSRLNPGNWSTTTKSTALTAMQLFAHVKPTLSPVEKKAEPEHESVAAPLTTYQTQAPVTSDVTRLTGIFTTVFHSLSSFWKSLPFFGTKKSAKERKIDPILVDPVGRELLSQSLQDLLRSPTLPVDDSLFLHVLGDRFGKGSGLEGHSQKSTLTYRLKTIESATSALETQHTALSGTLNTQISESVCQRLESLKFLKEKTEQALTLLNSFDQSETAFADAWRNSINCLKEEGDTFFMPAGWPGHAIAYIVTRQANGLYTFQVVNTGEGLEHHVYTTVGSQKLQVPTADIKDVTETRLTDHLFLHALRELKWSKLEGHQAIRPRDLYQTILHHLGGELVDSSFTIEDFIQPQRSGICAYMSLSATFGKLMADAQHAQHLEFQTRFITLVAYARQNERRFETEELPRRLVRKGLESFAYLANQSYKQNVISSTELDLARTTVRDLSAKLDYIDKTVKNKRQLEAKTFHPVAILDNSFSNSEGVIPYRDETAFNVNAGLEITDSYVAIQTSGWTPEPKQLVFDLTNYNSQIERALATAQSLTVIPAVQEIVLSIPLQKPEFWAQLNSVEAENVIGQLATLHRQLVQAMILNSSGDSVYQGSQDIESYLTAVKILAIADLLIHQHSSLLGPDFPSLYQPGFRDFLENGSGLLRFEGTKWLKPLCEIRSYWDEAYPPDQRDQQEVSFFGFELSPAHVTDSGKYYRTIALDEVSKQRYKMSNPNKYWDSDIIWPEFEWVRSWIQKPEVRSQLSTDLLSNSEFKLLQLTLDSSGISRQILPSTYLAVRDIAYLVDFIKIGPMQEYHINDKNLRFNLIAGLEYEAYESNSNEGSIILVGRNTLFSKWHYFNFENWKIFYHESSFSSTTTMHVANPRFSEATPRALDPWRLWMTDTILPEQWDLWFALFRRETLKNRLETDYDSPWKVRNRLNSNEVLFKEPPLIWDSCPKMSRILQADGSWKNRDDIEWYYGPLSKPPKSQKTRMSQDRLTLQEWREILSLSSLKGQQIQETLGYFKTHSYLLRQRPYQKFVNVLLLEDKFLETALAKHPEDAAYLLNELAFFTRSGFQLASSLHDWTTAVYFLHLNHRLKSRVKASQTNGTFKPPASYQNPFLDSRKKALTLVNLIPPEARQGVYQLLAMMHVDDQQLDAQGVQDVLVAALYRDIFPPVVPFEDNDSKVTLSQLLRIHRESIQRVMKSSENRDALNAVYKSIKPSAKLPEWDFATPFPFVKGKGPSGTVQIDLINGILFEGGQIKPLPTSIHKELFPTLLLTNSPPLSIELSPNRYSFEDIDGQKYEVTANEKGVVSISREVNGHWYNRLKYPYETDVKPRVLAHDMTFWISNRKIHEILAYRTSTHKREYRINIIENWFWGAGSYVVHKLDDKEQDTGLVLANILKPTPFEALSGIEDPDRTLVWVDSKSGNPHSIELPLLGLSFQIQEEQGIFRAYCDQLEGYRIADNQYVQSLHDFPHYLLLENPSKAPLVLFSPHQLEDSVNSSLDTTSRPDRKEMKVSSNYHVNEINPHTGVLTPRGDAARFYLAMIYLWKQDYQQASHLLRRYGSQLRRYTVNEVEILKWVSTLGSVNHDSDPRAFATRLRAWSMLSRNIRYFAQDIANDSPHLLEEEDRKKITEDYREYLNRLPELRNGWLTVEEEMLLLPQLKNDNVSDSGRFQGRLQELLGREPENHSILRLESVAVRRIPKVNERIFYPGALSFLNALDFSSNPSHLLRGNLATHFLDYYKMAKGEANGTEFMKNLERLAGRTFPKDLSKTESNEVFRRVLQYMEGNQANFDHFDQDDNYQLAWLIESVLEDPKAFPTTTVLTSHVKNHKHSMDIEIRDKVEESVLAPAREIIRKMGNRPGIAHHFNSIQLGEIKPPATPREKPDDSYAMCIRLVENPFLQRPVLATAASLVEEIPPTQDEITRAKMSASALQSVFSLKVEDTYIRNQFDVQKEQLDIHSKSPAAVPRHHRIKDLEALKSISKESKHDITTLAQFTEAGKERILQLANKLPLDATLATQRELDLASQKAVPLGIDEVVQLFATRDIQRFHNRNPGLEQEDIIQLFDDVQEWLLQKTQQQHLQRVKSSSDAVLKAIEVGMAQEELDLLVEAFVTVATSKREYMVSEFPMYLVFEYYMESLLRPEQKLSMDRLLIKNGQVGDRRHMGAVLEMIMGSGKTAVLLPLLSMLCADGDHLCMVIMPEALLPSMSHELQDRSGGSFGQRVEVMEFSPGMSLGVDRLETIRDRLKNFVKDGHILMMTNSSLQGFYLHYLLKMYKHLSATGIEQQRALEQEISLMREILGFMKAYGDITMDEVDFILDQLKSQHIALGERKPLLPEVVNTVLEIHRYLPTGSITPDTFDKQVKEPIIRKLLNGEFMESLEPLQTYLSGLSNAQRELLESYLKNESTEPVKAFYASIQSPLVKTILSLVQEQLNQLLPLTLKKKLFVHYGSVPDKLTPKEAEAVKDTRLLSTPYRSGEPAVTSQFGTDLEMLNYAIQMYREHGISQAIVELDLKRLQERSLKVQQKSHPSNLEKDEILREFEELTGKDAPFGLFSYKPEHLEQIAANVNRNRDLQLKLIQRYVVPQIKVYQTQLNSDAQLYGMLFSSIQGFSGTLWNLQTFPKMFAQTYESDTAATTLNLLWRRSPHKVDTLPDTEEGKEGVKTLVEALYTNRETPKGSYIDTAGLFAGIDGAIVAREIILLPIWKDKGIKGIVYYDRLGALMVMTPGNPPQNIPLDQCKLAPGELIAFWDVQHTTGSNIKLGPSMTATVSIGKQTLMRDLLQSVWRLRQLDRGQSVNFVVNESDALVIKETIAKITGRYSETLSLEDLLRYVLYNQAVQLGDHNHRSLMSKMKAVLVSRVLAVMIDSTVPVGELSKLYDATRDLFETKRSDDPTGQYGQLRSERSREEVVKEELDQILQSSAMKAFSTHPLLKQRYAVKDIVNEIRELAADEIKHLPNTLTKTDGFEREVSVEVEQQQEQEQQKQRETSREVERQRTSGIDSSQIAPRKVIRWDMGDLYTRQYFAPTAIGKLQGKGFEGAAHLRPLMRVGDLIENHGMEKVRSSMFDPNLLISLNLAPVDDQPGTNEYTPFGYYQKLSTQLLVIQDKTSGAIQTMLLDANDADMFSELLLQRRTEGPSEVRLGLYHFSTGLYRQGADPIDRAGLEKNESFQNLKMQAKFFNGEPDDYTPTELRLLKTWLKHNPKPLYDLYKTRILNWKDASKRAYEGSVLQKIFKDLGMET